MRRVQVLVLLLLYLLLLQSSTMYLQAVLLLLLLLLYLFLSQPVILSLVDIVLGMIVRKYDFFTEHLCKYCRRLNHNVSCFEVELCNELNYEMRFDFLRNDITDSQARIAELRENEQIMTAQIQSLEESNTQKDDEILRLKR